MNTKTATLKTPFLLYSYPWMPYPRRIGIYLKERGIPPSMVEIVPVKMSLEGDTTSKGYPPRPKGSLPILACPTNDKDFVYIHESKAIMYFLEELAENEMYGFSKPPYNMKFKEDSPIGRAKEIELGSLADELTTNWNPIRIYGSGAGKASGFDNKNAQVAKEMVGWVRRPLHAIDDILSNRDLSYLEMPQGSSRGPTISDILLYQFLEFTADCYKVDMSVGSGKSYTDVYNREQVDDYPHVRKFFELFKQRDSAKRDTKLGEEVPYQLGETMSDWAPGVFDTD